VTRSELYALVWRLPLRRLAPLLGMSDHGLSKLCGRHDIPVPDRGYWMRAAAGRAAPTSLPPRNDDETIPRFRAIDAKGAPLDTPDVEQWVIPGVLRASAPLAPGVDTAALRAALAGGQTADPPPREDQRGVTKPTLQRAATKPRQEPAERALGVAEPAVRLDHRRESGGGAFEVRTAALQAELERAFAAAAEHQQHQATLQLLNSVAVRAMDAEPAVARSILAWVSAMREGLEADEPVKRLVAALRSDADAPQRLWWRQP